MKYSIIISPKSKNSNATVHALRFIKSILKQNHHYVSVFFYGYAVKNAFVYDSEWNILINSNVSLMACSTIAEKHFFDSENVDYVK